MILDGESLLDPAVLAHPDRFYRRLVEEAPVWRVADTDIFTVASHAAVTEACARVEDFSSHLAYFLYRDDRGLPARHAYGRDSGVLATADPPRHHAHKKVISRFFSPKYVSALETDVRARTQHYLQPALQDGRIEFMGALANRIPIEIVSALIAFDEPDNDALARMAMSQTDMLASAISLPELERRMAISDDVYLWMFQQFQRAMAGGGAGILAALAQGVNAGEIDLVVAMTILGTLFAAGGESTSSLVGNSMLLLASDQPLQHQLRAHPDRIPRFIEESLRLEAPFRYHMRLATRDATLCGVDIPAGATLLLLWGAANRDPAAFDHPDEVDLDRPRGHVAFGSGIHVCLGNTLARLEARVILEQLLAATTAFSLDPDDPPVQVPSLVVRRLESLPLRLTPA